MCVSTAPVAEPIVMFTVPWIGCTIVATANVVTSSSSADCADCCRSVYVAMSCGGGFFTPGAAYDAVWDSVKPMTGNFFKYFQYQEFVECVCILNDCLSSNYDICPDNYNYSRFTLKDKCRSENWEVYLYGDMTIKVMGPDVQKTAEISAVAFHGVTGRLFSAVYTGTRPGFPCHQGGEGVAGTPGACSQVFCHPN